MWDIFGIFCYLLYTQNFQFQTRNFTRIMNVQSLHSYGSNKGNFLEQNVMKNLSGVLQDKITSHSVNNIVLFKNTPENLLLFRKSVIFYTNFKHCPSYRCGSVKEEDPCYGSNWLILWIRTLFFFLALSPYWDKDSFSGSMRTFTAINWGLFC